MEIRTKHLLLRPFTMDDVAPFATICADPRVMRYINGGVTDFATTKQHIQQWIVQYHIHGFGLLAMTLPETQQLIGFCGLIEQTVNQDKIVELGYRIAYQHWNRGFGTEAALMMKHHAFDALHLPELISIIHPDNIASQRIAEKVGMRFQQDCVYQGVTVNLYHMSNPGATAKS